MAETAIATTPPFLFHSDRKNKQQAPDSKNEGYETKNCKSSDAD
jgi:hypothetical protein